jgi:hypothetical protein
LDFTKFYFGNKGIFRNSYGNQYIKNNKRNFELVEIKDETIHAFVMDSTSNMLKAFENTNDWSTVTRFRSGAHTYVKQSSATVFWIKGWQNFSAFWFVYFQIFFNS